MTVYLAVVVLVPVRVLSPALAALLTERTRPERSRRAAGGRRRFSGHARDGRYCRARYYHPGLQRFIGEDPLEFGGGDVNLYSYVANDPLSNTDPTGEFLLAGCVAGAGWNLAGDVASYVLSGRKPSAGELLANAAIGCASGAVGAQAFSVAYRLVQTTKLIRNVERLTHTKTVLKNLDTRPFLDSSLTMREIMRARLPIHDPGGLPSGLRWDVAGTLNGSRGTWQLVVDSSKKIIVHFNFVRPTP